MAFPSVQEMGSARAIALGSTYVGIAEGSATLPWNPAGLAGICATEIGLHHNSTLIGSYQETAILGLPTGKASALGASFTYGDNGTYEGRDDAGNRVGDYAVRTYGASLGWGFQAMDDIDLGASLKFNRQDLAGTAVDAFAGDIGALWQASPDFNLGAAYNNLGPDVAGMPQGQALSLGASYYLWKRSDLQVLLALSGESLARGGDSVRFGIEPTLYHMLALRAGYSAALNNAQEVNGLTGWTFGGGVMLAGLALDYAYVPLGDLGDVQRVSLTYAFGDCKDKR
jgi:hypothetical protein